MSDGEFNASKSNKTNFQTFKKKLLKAGFPKDYVDNFKIVLWDIPNTFYGNEEIRPKFESYADTPNFFSIHFLVLSLFKISTNFLTALLSLFDSFTAMIFW